MRFIVLCLIALLSVSGCSLLPDQIDESEKWSAEELYQRAKDSLESGNYETAIKFYEKLEARYPFGAYAQQALLESAYAYHKFQEPESAIATADRFIKTYPRHQHVDYAYYLKGLANFNRGASFFDRIFPRDLSQRDASSIRQSFFDFQALVDRFPDSRYAADARLRMIHLRDQLARYEVHVADWYTRRGAYLAAVNRSKYVIEHYPGTSATPDALALMITNYRRLGMDDLAADAERVYRLNYPDAPALEIEDEE